ncbi:MAG: S8 family serine peptidase [Pseudomonadota bacterium]
MNTGIKDVATGRALPRRALGFAALVIIIGGAANAQQQPPPSRAAEQDATIRGLAEVRTTLQQSDRPLRVLAQLSEATVDPAGSTTRALPLTGMARTRIAAAARDASDLLKTQGISRVQTIEGLPLITFELDRDQLDAVAASGQFAIVTEDKLSRPYLGSSGPVIGVPDLHASGGTGNAQTVAILDTGVDTDHPFLNGRVVEGACFSSNFAPHGATSLCPGGADSATTVASGNHCTGVPGCDHGTHVAGIAAGRPTGGTTISGVAPDAEIMAVQVFSRFDDAPGGPNTCASVGTTSPCVLSYDSDQIRGLQRVVDRAAALNVVAANMSLGGGRFTGNCDADNSALKAIVDQLLSADAVTVIAAGNDGFTSAIGSPGCISTAVTVGSTTDADAVSGFSNLSATVDLLAPGSSIESSVPGTGFAVFNGTSMATPQVTGAFAAIASCAAAATQVGDIEAALDSTGTNVSDGRPGGTLTKNRIDVHAAAMAVGCGTTPPPVDTDCLSHNLSNLTLSSTGWWFWRRWWIVDGNRQLFYFGRNGGEAREALDIINRFRFSSTCYIGRPGPSMQYLRTGNTVPGGPHGTLDCIGFNRAGLRVEPIAGSQWRLTDGASSMLTFPNQAEAQQAVDAINHHRMNRQCFVGRPDASFTFWLAQ